MASQISTPRMLIPAAVLCTPRGSFGDDWTDEHLIIAIVSVSISVIQSDTWLKAAICAAQRVARYDCFDMILVHIRSKAASSKIIPVPFVVT